MGQNEGGEFVAQLTETGPPPLCHWLLLLLVLRLAVGVVVGRPVGTRGVRHSQTHCSVAHSNTGMAAQPHQFCMCTCTHAHFMHMQPKKLMD